MAATGIDHVLDMTADRADGRPRQEGPFELVGTADDLRLAFAAAREAGGDVVLIAPNDQNGLCVMRPGADGDPRTNDTGPQAPAVVIVAPTQDPSFLLGALSAGADGVVLASSPPQVLHQAITTTRKGGVFIDPAVSEMTGEVLAGLVRGWAQFDLSPRELQVLWWLPTGLSCAAIANQVGVTEGTVKSYLHRIQTKLGAEDRMQLLAIARRQGLL